MWLLPGIKTIQAIKNRIIEWNNQTRIFEYGCSNVAKLIEKNIYIFKKKICTIFTKTLFFSVNFFFFQIKLCIQNKYLYPLSKKLTLLKKISFCLKYYV